MAKLPSMDSILGRLKTPGQVESQTPAEQDALAQQLAKDDAAIKTQVAEQQVKKLPPGHQEWLCPDMTCHVRFVGPPNGDQHKAYRSHCERHHHARHPAIPRPGVAIPA